MKELPDRPLEEQAFIVQDRDGDYLERLHGTDRATVKWHYYWTKKREKAQVFTYRELFVRGAEALSAKEQDKALWMNLVVGFAGVTSIRVR